MARNDELRIGVVGLGRVGLITAVGLAELGWHVLGADEDVAKSRVIRKGEVPFFEPGVEELLRRHIRSGRFVVEDGLDSVMAQATVIFVCVGTPEGEDGAADLTQLSQVAGTIGSNLDGYKLIIEKSTSPVRTAHEMKRIISQHSGERRAVPAATGRNGADFDVAVNPEFLREGMAMHDFLQPNRIVLGVDNQRAESLLLRVYRPLLDRMGAVDDSRVIVTDTDSAEIIKHAANAFLATKVSFANMVADLCEVTGANVDHVTKGLGMDPRIGPYMKAGIGYGGSCLPKDVRAFTWVGERHGVDFSFLREVHRVNERRVDVFLSKVRKAVSTIEDKTFGVWGLAFKPGTDDVRDAPSLRVVHELLSEGARLRLYDPRAMDEFRHHFQGSDRLLYCASPEEAAEGAHALLILTEWTDFLDVNLAEVREGMAVPVIVDGRNLLSPSSVRDIGFQYLSVGRP